MLDMTHNERVCGRLAKSLEAGERDVVDLLRTARTLKRLYIDARLAVRAYIKEEGRTQHACLAEEALDRVEQDLRTVLLGHLYLQAPQMHMYVKRATTQSLKALYYLTYPAETKA